VFVIIAIITFVFAIAYTLLILNFRRGWNSFAPLRLCESLVSRKAAKPQNQFSIIISARNEEQNIWDCLLDIITQDYPSENFEIIVIDDFSEDNTAEIVQQFALENQDYSIRLTKLSDEPITEKNSFKKAAIKTGIEKSRFPWIITSDADCGRGNKWLESIASFIHENDPVMVSAPVCLKGSDGFFDLAQSLEFMGLVGIGAASLALKSPNMCNGANLAYKKGTFYEVKGFEGNDDLASGDDEFLMHKMFAKWPDKVLFLKSEDAIVSTRPEASFSSFIEQRKRWVSKSRKYSNNRITLVLTGAWIFHLMLLFSWVAGFFAPAYFFIFLIAFGLKVGAEFLFLNKVGAFFNQRKAISVLIPSCFAYIFYVLFIGIYGNFGSYTWKGRRVN